MVNVRCTKSLLSKLGITRTSEEKTPTNILGDWYANNFNIGHKQYIIFTNEITALSVIVTKKEISSTVKRFSQSLRQLLTSIGIDKEMIEIELKELLKINLSRIKDRSITDNMNNLIKGIKVWFETESNPDLSQLNVYLAGHLTGPAPFHIPKDKAYELFHKKETINFFQVDKLQKR